MKLGPLPLSVQEVQPKRLQFGGDVVPPPPAPLELYLGQVAENDACTRSALVAVPSFKGARSACAEKFQNYRQCQISGKQSWP
jgi:hypothetical protein